MADAAREAWITGIGIVSSLDFTRLVAEAP